MTTVFKTLFFSFLIFGHMWDLSSPTRDQTHAPCSGTMESKPLDSQGSPNPLILLTICVPGIVLSAEHKAVNETESFQTFTKPKFWSRELDNEQINK